jgi:hypothetical protein
MKISLFVLSLGAVAVRGMIAADGAMTAAIGAEVFRGDSKTRR